MVVNVLLKNKKFRVGYHWTKSSKQNGGIIRYVKNIIENDNVSDIDFINFADRKIFIVSILGRFLFILDFLFPYFKVKKKKIDIYWGIAHKLPWFRVKAIPYIVTIHDLVWKTCPHTMPLRRRLAERFFFPIAIRNADIILAVSQSTANDIFKYFPSYADKVRVIPLAGVPTEHSNIATSHAWNEKYILFVGTIEPRKNVLNMLKAYSTLPKALKKKYKFYILGNIGWGDMKLEEMIVELELTRYVEWKTAVNDQELIKFYQNAYCLLFPSLYEGFGLPIIEAQSFGVPVITSNLSSMPEVVGEGGLLVNPISVDSIKNAIKNLLENVELRDSLSQRAKINSRRFSWKETSQATCLAFSESMDLRDT